MDATPSSRNRWRVTAVMLLASFSFGTAMAQWQWIDGTGSRVFSDTPPPAGTPDKNILKRPGGSTVRASAPEAPPTANAEAPTTVKPAAQDKELEARKKQAEDAEKAKQKAELEKLAKARAENCERAKRAKATVDSGVRLATTNAKGEREVMDDTARNNEARRLDEIIRSDCGPLPAAQ